MAGTVESHVDLVVSCSAGEKLLGNAVGRDDWNEKEGQQQTLQANLEPNSSSRHRPGKDVGPAHCVKLVVCRKKIESTNSHFELEHYKEEAQS
jgi:hypothetical protein